jgi:DNA-binding NarL/FixJ family response regulator
MGKRQRKRVRQQPLSAAGSITSETNPWHVPSLSPAMTSGLQELAGLVDEQGRLSDRQRRVVAELVAAGTSWPAIAAALGVTRQAARQQFLRTHRLSSESG